MSALMDVLEFVRVYLNYFFFITSGSFEEHLAKVEDNEATPIVWDQMKD